MYINEISYISNQTLQYKDAQKLLTENLSQMEWEKEEGVVMDLGCGPGNTTFQLILPFFSNLTKLVAVDLLPNMIDFAKQNHSHPKIEYEVANIEDREIVKRWHGKISKLVSIQCMHWLKNQKLGFQNIYEILKQEGEAAFYFALKSPFWDALRSTVDDRKWNAYLKDLDLYIPDSHNRENNLMYYKEMLEEVGFTVLLYDESDVQRTFQSNQECKGYFASLCIVLHSVPVELREEFIDHLFEHYLSIVGRSKTGAQPQHTSTFLRLVVKKEK